MSDCIVIPRRSCKILDIIVLIIVTISRTFRLNSMPFYPDFDTCILLTKRTRGRFVPDARKQFSALNSTTNIFDAQGITQFSCKEARRSTSSNALSLSEWWNINVMVYWILVILEWVAMEYSNAMADKLYCFFGWNDIGMDVHELPHPVDQTT